MYQRCPLEALDCEAPALGGSKEYLWVIRAEHVSAIPTGCDGEETTDPVQIQAGTTSIRYTFPYETLGFQENQRYDKGGEYFEIILEGFRDKISPHHQHEICKLAPGYYLVIYQDANGYVRLLGTPDKPLRFTSAADTKKQRSELNGVLWRFYGVSRCPSIFMDPSIPPPNELLVPLARLTINQVPILGSCFSQITANGSRLSNGNAIDATTPYGTAILKYRFYYGAVLLYEVTIGPDEDATDSANWNYISGSRDFAAFTTEVIDQIITGTGFQFTLDLHVLSLLDGAGTLRMELVVDDWSQVSAPDEASVSLCLLREAYTMTTTLQIGFLIQVVHSTVQNMYVDWGDGNIGVYRNVPALISQIFTYNYASAGSYDVKVYLDRREDLTYLYVANDQLTSLYAGSLVGMEIFHARSNMIANDQVLQNLTSLKYINIRSNEDIQAIYLPSSAPLETFIAYHCMMVNPLDFRPFSATLEWVEVYSNDDLQYCEVAGCPSLTDYLARNCDLLNDQDLTGCTALGRVEIQNNPSLAFVDVSGLTNLYKYYAYYCDIQNDQDLSAAGIFLQDVRINGNEISVLTLGNHPDLNTLYAHDNDLSGVYNLNLCISLVSLDLSGNNITDVVIDQCTLLERIQVDNNNIDSTELNRIVDDVYAFRAVSAATGKIFKLHNNTGTLNATSLDKINGTGAYLGDGLVDHGWTVTA